MPDFYLCHGILGGRLGASKGPTSRTAHVVLSIMILRTRLYVPSCLLSRTKGELLRGCTDTPLDGRLEGVAEESGQEEGSTVTHCQVR